MIFESDLFGQNKKAIDSLFTVLKTTSSDTVKIKTLNNLTRKYWLFKPDSALLLMQTSCKIAERVAIPKFTTSSLNYLGYSYFKLAQYDSAQSIFKKSIEISSLNDLKKSQAYAINYLGDTYNLMGLYDEATACYLNAINIQEEINDKKGLSSTYNSLGTIFELQKEYDKAIEYYTLSLKLKIQFNDKNGQTISYHNIANCYQSLMKYSNAVSFFQKAIELSEFEGNFPNLAMCFYSLGNCYCKINDYKNGLVYHKKAYQIYEKLKDHVGLANCNFALANDYSRSGNLDLGFNYLKKSEQIAQNIEYLDLLISIYKEYYQYYNIKKDFKNAYNYSIKYIELNDSVYNLGKSKEIIELNTKYETEKKEQQNKLLQIENNLSATKFKQQQIITYFIITALILLIGLSFFIFNGLKNQRKANKIISLQKQEVEAQKLIVEHQKQLVEEHQKETLDSIHYAKRIQNALLANKELVDAHLKNNFVLFKPKDIVSGDFYWATEHNNKFYLAICDSTGHGVPGAFMSLLNMGFLSEAIKEKDIVKPNEIFNFVRARLESTISNEGQKDGMDGILICLDKKTKELTYAAANNEPILICNNRIIELPKDKMPVGKGEKKETFTLQTTSLNPGDVLYLYTDGFADQFGGPKGKKYKYKQLNELLLEISSKPLIQQSEILNSTFERWRGELEQVDDVTVIGIKI